MAAPAPAEPVKVVFDLAGPLRQHAGGAGEVDVEVAEGASVTDALDALGKLRPGVERRVRDDEGNHVNLFVGDDLISDEAPVRMLTPAERWSCSRASRAAPVEGDLIRAD